MKKYEMTFAFVSDKSKEALAQVEDIFSKNQVKVLTKNELGERPLAYEIAKQNRAVYCAFVCEAPGLAISKIEAQVMLDNRILRHLFIVVE